MLAAALLRGLLLFPGVALVRHFRWLLVPFGGFLLFSAVRLVLKPPGPELVPRENAVVRAARRVLPIARDTTTTGVAFLIREDGRWRFTPLFLVLVMVETTDLLFAFDSIPAVLGMSQDAFIVYASNICAVIGLRSLFSVLEGLIGRLAYLRAALAAVLGFVGVKMLLEPWLHVGLWVSLLVIASLLSMAVLASVLRAPQEKS